MILREDAVKLLESRLSNQNLVKHCLATEAIMRALAAKRGADAEEWGTTGLLHDLDFEETKDTAEKHGLATAELMAQKGFSSAAVQAVKAHNAEALGLERSGDFDLALTCAEQITGLIVATALVMPDKKLASVKAKSVAKRMKEKSFARQVDRDLIMLCEQMDIPLPDFIDLSLSAMCGISDELGL